MLLYFGSTLKDGPQETYKCEFLDSVWVVDIRRKCIICTPGFWKRFILFVCGWSMLLQVHIIGKNYLNELIHIVEVIWKQKGQGESTRLMRVVLSNFEAMGAWQKNVVIQLPEPTRSWTPKLVKEYSAITRGLYLAQSSVI